MLKGNLSTRPFYNDRIVSLAIGLAALVVVALTLINLTQLVTLSASRAAARERLQTHEQEAARIAAEAAALQGRIDRPTLVRLASSTREANRLIDERTFSWTGLLALLEDTLPPDVRLTAISPRAESGVFRVSMAIVARDLDNITEFVDALTDTGRFYDVAPTEQRLSDDGSYRAVIQAAHLPATAIPAAPGAAGSTTGSPQ
jgi:Tfp pilus assembly protein PilN